MGLHTPAGRVLLFVASNACIFAAASACSQDATAPPVLAAPDAAAPTCSGGTAVAGGGCAPVGVLADGCAAGFVYDGRGGCAAIQPSEPCGPGTLALPGETTCRAVAACPSDPYGDAPEDATTQHVDGKADQATSDGTRAHPWTTVQAAIAAASPGAVIAIAEGKYSPSVAIDSKPVRLWGRCPDKVQLSGVAIRGAIASKSEVHALRVVGNQRGVAIEGASDVVVDRAWIFATFDIGLDVEDGSATVTRSLIEETHDLGVLVFGKLTIEESVVRGTKPRIGDGEFGGGIDVEVDRTTRAPSELHARTVIVEDNRDLGVFMVGTNATLDGVLVRDTQPDSTGAYGRGIDIEDDAAGALSNVTMRGVVLERNHDLSLFVAGSTIDMQNVTVRDSRSTTKLDLGRGVHVQDRIEAGHRAKLTMSHVLVDGAFEVGVYVADSDALLDGVWIRGVNGRERDGTFGDGLSVFSAGESLGAKGTHASVEVRASRVEAASRAGVSSFGSSIALSATTIECNGIPLDGEREDTSDFSFVDRGDNRCGCDGARQACLALTSKIEAPKPIR